MQFMRRRVVFYGFSRFQIQKCLHHILKVQMRQPEPQMLEISRNGAHVSRLQPKTQMSQMILCRSCATCVAHMCSRVATHSISKRLCSDSASRAWQGPVQGTWNPTDPKVRRPNAILRIDFSTECNVAWGGSPQWESPKWRVIMENPSLNG